MKTCFLIFWAILGALIVPASLKMPVVLPEGKYDIIFFWGALLPFGIFCINSMQKDYQKRFGK